MPQKEIAEKLDISLSTVKRILREARNFLEGSEFTINRSDKVKSAITEFVSSEAKRLYTLYTQENENAPDNEYDLALAKLKTYTRIFLSKAVQVQERVI